jgi:hypothetical protein
MRLDKNEVFYIGIGSDEEGEYKRAFSKHNRSFHWKNITIKTDYQVEIILDDLTWEEACLKEIEFIKLYGRKDLNEGTLINLTDGGDGALGLIFSETHKKKIGESNKGKHSDYIFTEEHKKKLSDSLKGHKTSQETREKISRSNSGKIRSEEAKKKMSNASLGNKKRLGKKHSEETKKKMSLKGKGRVVSEESRIRMGAWKRKPCSEERKQRLREINTGKPMSENARKALKIALTGRPCSQKTKENAAKANSKIIFNICTGVYYDSIKEAAFYNNIKRTTLTAMLVGQNKNKTNLIYT